MESQFTEISVPSSLDGSLEPSLLYLPENPKALVVGLHTWSHDRYNQVKPMFPHCEARGWALLLPEFRGSNLTTNPRVTEAGGSSLARRDIVDATNWVLDRHFAKRPPVFLLGGSGGGHMALMVAAREEFNWDAVSSWCPISDLAAWYRENEGYGKHVHAICGGAPDDSEEVAKEYRERSPIHYVEALKGRRLQVAHGRHDRAVPCSHSWKVAHELKGEDAFYFSIFDGKHELRAEDAFRFFDDTVNAVGAEQLTS